jgi:catechol 2,3-dioxygenase-like lactoylglutathione lyase family enzyme
MSKRVVPMIHVPDVRATVEWYEELGFNVVATYGNETNDGYSFGIVSFGDSQVMFSQDGETSTKHRREVDLYVYTDDVDEIYERLKDRVEVVEGPHDRFYGMREVIIRDLNRFWITFGQESNFSTLMSGVFEGEPELVRKAVESGKLDLETLSVALAASAGKNAEVEGILKNAGAKPAPKVALETLQSYAGKYKGSDGPEVEITVKDGKLFVAPGAQQPMSLWPLDQTTFKPIAFEGGTVSFKVEGGKTVGITFEQDDFKMELKRV